MLRVCCLILAGALNSAAAFAEPMISSVISSVETGIVCPPEPIGSTPAPGTIAGATHIIAEEPQFVSVGTVVPAAIGVGFGVKSQAVNPEGLGPVTMVLTHPPMGDTQVTLQQFQTSISGQDSSLTFYQFDYPYELVEGSWMFTAMQGERALFSVTFEVVDPRGMPSLAEMCGYSNLFS